MKRQMNRLALIVVDRDLSLKPESQQSIRQKLQLT